MNQPTGVRARLLVAVMTAEGQMAQLWAVEDSVTAAQLHNRLRQDWSGVYEVQICTPGDLIATELLHVAAELDRVALGDGADPALNPGDLARRDGISAAAAVLRHRGQHWRRWQP